MKYRLIKVGRNFGGDAGDRMNPEKGRDRASIIIEIADMAVVDEANQNQRARQAQRPKQSCRRRSWI